jgi:hypothetical protein
MKFNKLFILFVVVVFLNSINSNAQIGPFVRSEEFKVFKHKVSTFEMGESFNKDWWFADFDLQNVDVKNNDNDLTWGDETITFLLLISPKHLIISYQNTMGGAGQTLIYNRNAKSIKRYTFVGQELMGMNILKGYSTGISFKGPQRGRYWRSFVLDLSTLKVKWGVKDFN